MPRPAVLYNHRKWQLIGKSQWCGSAMLQLQHTLPPQSTTPGLHPASIHQMSPPVRGSKHPITAYYSVYRPRKDERLSRPAWLVTYRNKVPPSGVEHGHVTHPSTNRARRRVTSLIRPTMLPLSHAATTTPYFVIFCHLCWPWGQRTSYSSFSLIFTLYKHSELWVFYAASHLAIAVFCYIRSSVVCPSVCLLVTLVSPAKRHKALCS